MRNLFVFAFHLPKISNSVLQSENLAHFSVGEGSVEHPEIVHSADLGGPQDELYFLRFLSLIHI